jgi:Flp pilus assembly pilin Flp
MAMKHSLGKFLRNCSGATAIEYGLITALVALAMLAGLITLTDANTANWDKVSAEVQDAR